MKDNKEVYFSEYLSKDIDSNNMMMSDLKHISEDKTNNQIVIHRTLKSIEYVSQHKKQKEEPNPHRGQAASLHAPQVPLGTKLNDEQVDKSIDLRKNIVKGLKTDIKKNIQKARQQREECKCEQCSEGLENPLIKRLVTNNYHLQGEVKRYDTSWLTNLKGNINNNVDRKHKTKIDEFVNLKTKDIIKNHEKFKKATDQTKKHIDQDAMFSYRQDVGNEMQQQLQEKKVDTQRDNGTGAFETLTRHAQWRAKAVSTGTRIDNVFKLSQDPSYIQDFATRADQKTADNTSEMVDQEKIKEMRSSQDMNDLQFLKHPEVRKVNKAPRAQQQDEHKIFSKMLKDFGSPNSTARNASHRKKVLSQSFDKSVYDSQPKSNMKDQNDQIDCIDQNHNKQNLPNFEFTYNNIDQDSNPLNDNHLNNYIPNPLENNHSKRNSQMTNKNSLKLNTMKTSPNAKTIPNNNLVSFDTSRTESTSDKSRQPNNISFENLDGDIKKRMLEDVGNFKKSWDEFIEFQHFQKDILTNKDPYQPTDKLEHINNQYKSTVDKNIRHRYKEEEHTARIKATLKTEQQIHNLPLNSKTDRSKTEKLPNLKTEPARKVEKQGLKLEDDVIDLNGKMGDQINSLQKNKVELDQSQTLFDILLDQDPSREETRLQSLMDQQVVDNTVMSEQKTDSAQYQNNFSRYVINPKVSHGFINLARQSMNVNKNFKNFINKLLNLKNTNTKGGGKGNAAKKNFKDSDKLGNSKEEEAQEEFDLGKYSRHLMQTIYAKNKELKIKLMDEVAEFQVRKNVIRRKLFKVMEQLADDKQRHFYLRQQKLTDPSGNMLRTLTSLNNLVEQHRFRHFMELKKELDRYNNILDNAIKLQPHPAIFFICDFLKQIIESNRTLTSNLLKWALVQIRPLDQDSQFPNLLKIIMDTQEIGFYGIQQFLMQRGIELSSDLFDTQTIQPVRESVHKLFKNNLLDIDESSENF